MMLLSLLEICIFLLYFERLYKHKAFLPCGCHEVANNRLNHLLIQNHREAKGIVVFYWNWGKCDVAMCFILHFFVMCQDMSTSSIGCLSATRDLDTTRKDKMVRIEVFRSPVTDHCLANEISNIFIGIIIITNKNKPIFVLMKSMILPARHLWDQDVFLWLTIQRYTISMYTSVHTLLPMWFLHQFCDLGNPRDVPVVGYRL